MFIEQKVSLWDCRVEDAQVLVLGEYMLTVTDDLGEGNYAGTLRDGSMYIFRNGYWSPMFSEKEMRLETAVYVWNYAMRNPRESKRVVFVPKGDDIIPYGDVGKCHEHNRYFLLGSICAKCR